jgi:hypothetical protein
MAVIKKTTDVGEDVVIEQRDPKHCLWEHKLVQVEARNCRRFLKNLKNKTTV